MSGLGPPSCWCGSGRVTPLLLRLHRLQLNLVVVPPQVYSRLCCGEEVEEVAQVERPLVQSKSLVHAACLNEVEPCLGAPRPDICFDKQHRGESVGDERDQRRRAEEVFRKCLGSGLCLASANMPLGDAKDVDGKGGEKYKEGSNASEA